LCYFYKYVKPNELAPYLPPGNTQSLTHNGGTSDGDIYTWMTYYKYSNEYVDLKFFKKEYIFIFHLFHI